MPPSSPWFGRMVVSKAAASFRHAGKETVVERIHSVYVVRGTHDGRRCVLYVGSTSRGMTRFHEHAATRAWWPMMRTTTWYHRSSRKAALATERRLITQLRPVFNGDGEC